MSGCSQPMTTFYFFLQSGNLLPGELVFIISNQYLRHVLTAKTFSKCGNNEFGLNRGCKFHNKLMKLWINNNQTTVSTQKMCQIYQHELFARYHLAQVVESFSAVDSVLYASNFRVVGRFPQSH